MIDTDFDARHLWHPYTSSIHPLPCYPVSHTSGVHIFLEDGKALIDGMSSWWCTIHGYNHPAIIEAIKIQADRMPHVMFGGLTHEPAITLGKTLLKLTDNIFDHVFLADSGSISVEVALKMALQYQQGVGEKKRTRLGALLGGYHGDTIGAMSVCDPINGMHSLFSDILPKAAFLPRPVSKDGEPLSEVDKEALTRFFSQHSDELAAIILEPLAQGAGGMYFYSADYLKALKEHCDKYGILLIFDEIATGFGRAGSLFAFQEAGVTPDILTLGKGLTGGTMTLAATLCNAKIAQGVSKSAAGVFMHGPTFMGNPLACAAANASLSLLEKTDWQAKVKALEVQLTAELSPLSNHPNVMDVRIKGSIGVVELHQPVDVAKFQVACVNLGVWIRPFGKLVYIMPPYIINQQQVSQLTDAMTALIHSH